MSLRLQRPPPRRPAAGGQGGPLSEQLSQLHAGIEEQEKESKALRTETGELRLNIEAAAGRAEALEVEIGALRKQVNQLTSSISGLGEQIAVVAGALQAGFKALSAAAGAIETQDAGNARQTAELKSLLIEQQRQQAELTAGLVSGRERIATQLDQLANLEGVFQNNLEKLALAAEEMGQGLGTTLGGQIERLGNQMADLAATERASIQHFQPELEKVLGGGKNLEQVLHSVDGNLGRIVMRSEQVLALHKQEQRSAATRDASQLNSAGLKCLGEGNLEGAASYFERARKLAPESFEPVFNLAVTCLRGQDIEGAQMLIAELESRHPDRKELELLRGASSLSRGDLEGAWDSLQRAAEAGENGSGLRDGAALAALVKERFGSAGSASAFMHGAEGKLNPADKVTQP